MNQSTQASVAQIYEDAKYASVLFDETRTVIWKNRTARQPIYEFVDAGLFKKQVFTRENEEIIVRGGTAYVRLGLDFADASGLMLSKVGEGCLMLFDGGAGNSMAGRHRYAASGMDCFTNLVRDNLDRLNLSAETAEHVMDSDDPEVERMFSNIRKSAYQILRGLGNLTLYTKYLSGVLTLARRNCDVGELVQVICLSIQSVLTQQIKIEVAVKDGPISANVDLKLCERALMNLLLNAILYTRDGNHISVTVSADADVVQVIVRDFGAGIREENALLATRPFFSVEPADDGGEAPGLGLGLSIASLFCEMHGGALVLNSRFGEGTTVALSFKSDLADAPDFHAAISTYVTDRFSPLYIELSGVCEIPR